jgi:phosphomannomutase/phosphoglucomutase
MTVPAHIFREYDIRGVVGEDFHLETAEAVGRAFGTAIRREGGAAGGRFVVVGADNRPSSPSLSDALISGLLSTGVGVRELGTVPTPVTYWAEKKLGAHGAIQITGSHNPPEWNGIKMTLGGRPYYGDDVTALRTRVLAEDFDQGEGVHVPVQVLDEYVADVARRFRLERSIKAVIDCGNGAGSLVAERLLRSVGVDVIPLYCESDGTFPNHHPDPSVDENLTDLIVAVRENGADVGIAFDGDADRIGAVDERGRVIRGDVLLLLFGLDLLETGGRDQLLVYDVKCSQALPEVFEAAGGRAVMWKTGHSLIKEKMRETGASIGGELSGHICFADSYIGTDDALYAACRLAALVSRSEASLAARTDALPSYVSTPEVRIEVTEESKSGIVDAAVEHFRRQNEVIDIDGARILFSDGWALLRASNTQPVLVARFEARTEDGLASIRGEVEGWLRQQGVDV